MGFIADLFSGSKAYQAQSGLQPGQLGQTYEDQKKAMEQMAAFVAATQPGGGDPPNTGQGCTGVLSPIWEGSNEGTLDAGDALSDYLTQGCD